MSMRRFHAPLALLALAAALIAACGTTDNSATPPAAGTPDPTGTTDVEAVATSAAAAPNTSASNNGNGGGGGGGTWPSPEDCLSYNPATVTVGYEAGIWSVRSGGVELIRVFGGPDAQQQGTYAANLAKRYRKVCFIGRGNHREEKTRYVFEYWRDPTGASTTLPDPEEACSDYAKNNLSVDESGDDAYRVKDHDHVLQEFDTRQDAESGKIVLAKYSRICQLDSETPDGTPAPISYA